MAAFNKFQPFVENLGRKVFNLNADSLKVMLVNSPAPVNTNSQKSNLTEIGAGNGYTATGTVVGTTAYAQAAGVGKLTGNDVVFTAAGGSIGPFRYAVLYDDTATNDELIAWWDYGASITLLDGETFTVDFSAANGILQVT